MRLSKSGIDPSAVLEAASESIIVTTSDLEQPGPTIIYANPAFERMTGWVAAEIVGKSPRILQGENTDRSVFSRMRATLRRGDRWEGQAINYRKDGTQFVMEWSITPLRDAAGRVTNYVAVQRDVTARVEAERRIAQAQAATRKSDRRKANLARYFSPKTAEILAQRDNPLGPVRRQQVGVLFVDIVGFRDDRNSDARANRCTSPLVLSANGEGHLRTRRVDREFLQLPVLSRLSDGGRHRLRGVTQPVQVWTCK